MKKILILDDERNVVDHFPVFHEIHGELDCCEIVYARNSREFKEMILDSFASNNNFHIITFDHDLQDFYSNGSSRKENTGYDCILWLLYHLMNNHVDQQIFFRTGTRMFVHTKNPIGARRIKACIDNDFCKLKGFSNVS